MIPTLNSNLHNALSMGNVTNGSNLNDVTDMGVYFMSRTYSFTNSPISGEWATLEVHGGNATEGSSRFQRITAASGVYYRTVSSNTWTAWNKLTMTPV